MTHEELLDHVQCQINASQLAHQDIPLDTEGDRLESEQTILFFLLEEPERHPE